MWLDISAVIERVVTRIADMLIAHVPMHVGEQVEYTCHLHYCPQGMRRVLGMSVISVRDLSSSECVVMKVTQSLSSAPWHLRSEIVACISHPL